MRLQNWTGPYAAMGDVHRLILQHGVEGARSMAATKAERQAVDAAASIMTEEESRLGITHAGFAMTSLPHKRIEDSYWKREGHRTTLLVESGRDRRGNVIGVPYGSIARLILLYPRCWEQDLRSGARTLGRIEYVHIRIIGAVVDELLSSCVGRKSCRVGQG